MKHSTKQALYESIMRNVGRRVRKALNESHTLTVNEYYDKLIENEIATEEEVQLVTTINGYSVETLDSILYARTGYRDWAQYAEAELGEIEDEEFEDDSDEEFEDDEF